jgi:hypothetical protein
VGEGEGFARGIAEQSFDQGTRGDATRRSTARVALEHLIQPFFRGTQQLPLFLHHHEPSSDCLLGTRIKRSIAIHWDLDCERAHIRERGPERPIEALFGAALV